MSFYAQQFFDNQTAIQQFLKLPGQLYTTRTIKQNYEEEHQILTQKHPLSHYFSFTGFLVYSEDQVVARALLVVYPDDLRGYIGYYECSHSSAAAKALFEAISQRAKELHITYLVGPYNANFWLQYRLKLDTFDASSYTGEPSNLGYYAGQWKRNGFALAHTYVSNEYGFKFNRSDAAQFTKATKRARSKSYIIKSPQPREFDTVIRTVHELITKLYFDFPGYKPITVDEFVSIAQSFRPILDYHFVKFAYADQEPVGFVVGFPDYGNLLYRPQTTITRIRIGIRKIRAPRYIIMYLGVLPEHTGLGKALVRPLVISALLRGARTIGALALVNKVTAGYGAHMIKRQFHYGLFEKRL